MNLRRHHDGVSLVFEYVYCFSSTMRIFLWALGLFVLSQCKISDTGDDSATLDYSYYSTIQDGFSMHDQTMTTLDFDPDDE